jgi:hypothetical protein
MPFSRPAKTEPRGSVDRFRPENHVGHLLLITPTHYEEGVRTRFGVKPTITANVAVVDGPMTGTEYDQAYL